MWYLFYEIWVFLVAAFVLGWIVAYLVFSLGAKREANSKPDNHLQTDSGRPASLSMAPVASDDLKRISGIGAVIENTLNSLGIYQFAQIADWSKENVAWVEDSLKFKGRIGREEWVEQAKILAAGRQTDFSQRVDEGEVDYDQD